MIPFLSDLTTNAFTIKNSTSFAKEILQFDPSKILVSFDVSSLFTNIPLVETTNFILGRLFQNDDNHMGIDKASFRKLLQISTQDSYFLFNDSVYQQIDGVSMGSPLAPTLANIFMCDLERKFMENCPLEFKPCVYKRYVDDTLALFDNLDQAKKFLQYINKIHPNINFTMETEEEMQLPFLDILISRKNNTMSTGIYRKPTFTGLGTNFFSYIPTLFKINAMKTLLHRAYEIASDFGSLHNEFEYLKTFFKNNGYPEKLVEASIFKLLNSKYSPKFKIPTVPKQVRYLSVPHIGYLNRSFSNDIRKILQKYFPALELKIIFNNPFKMASLFRLKDSLCPAMRSNVVYEFTCPHCKRGVYIGSTKRLLRIRLAGHKGTSFRTGRPLTKAEDSAIRDHADSCKIQLKVDNFKILDSCDSNSLRILESIYIKSKKPSLNLDSSASPLFLI